MRGPSKSLFLFVVLLFLPPGNAWCETGAEWINHLLRLPLPERMEFCGEEVPLDREDVAERLDLELMVILGSPVTTAVWWKRIPRYMPEIERELKARGLPDDLKYVALVESNLRATAVSRAGAVGPWQFIRGTAASYDLQRTGWKDDRRDWELSTQAALQHLSDLHECFGSWALALAAYNSGRSRVAEALETQGQSDYYGLRLPRETERYVVRALAAKLIVENPGAYGIRLEGARTYAPLDAAPVVVQVSREQLPVAAVARAAGVSYRTLVEWNPWIVGAHLPRGKHEMLVPAPAAKQFGKALSRWEADNPEPRKVYYTVRSGDNLTAIARRHSVELGDLLMWNGLSRRSVIRPGQELVVRTVD